MRKRQVGCRSNELCRAAGEREEAEISENDRSHISRMSLAVDGTTVYGSDVRLIEPVGDDSVS